MSATAIVLVGVALAPVALFAFLFAGVAVAYARRALWKVVTGTVPRASFALLVREAWAQLVVLGWTLARRGRALDHPAGGGDDDGGAAGPPVILVHGLAADGSSMFGWRRAVAEALGRRTFAPDLGGMFRKIERYADRLIGELDLALAASQGNAVDVVCHSMGGIVLRYALTRRPDIGARIRHVVTVATPHTGTAGARHLPLIEARQLKLGAPFIDGLPTLPHLLQNARFTTIASAHDAVVYPSSTCAVAGAAHHEVAGIGHAELLTHKRVANLVVDALR